MILRLLRALRSLAVDPHNYYRELCATNWRLRIGDPADWLRFKSLIQREMANRRPGVPGITSLALDAIFPEIGRSPVMIFPIPPQPFNVSWHELVVLAAITNHLRPKQVFEFGTFDGRTSLHLAANAPRDSVLHTIDVAAGPFDFGTDSRFCEPVSVGRWFHATGHEMAIDVITGDTATHDFSPYRGRIDMVFIDADHGEAAVLRDSTTAFDLLTPDGIVIWHDYLMIPDVTRALTHLAEHHPIVHVAGTTLALTRSNLRGGTPA